MEWSCEEDIIRDLQHGDRKAYSFLFKKYYPMLCAYCSRFVSLEDAEEIVQDTLFWLWKSREEICINKSLGQYLLRLPPSYREAFVMHRFQQMSYKEIADQLHVSTKTVDYRIQQALKQLRTDLKDYLPLLILLSLN